MGMLAATACSQPSIKFRPGNEAKSFGKSLLTDAVGMGAAGGYDYWLHCGDRNGIGILSTDSTLHHARQATLPHSSHYTMLAASHNDQQAALLLADAHSSHEASILTAEALRLGAPRPVLLLGSQFAQRAIQRRGGRGGIHRQQAV